MSPARDAYAAMLAFQLRWDGEPLSEVDDDALRDAMDVLWRLLSDDEIASFDTHEDTKPSPAPCLAMVQRPTIVANHDYIDSTGGRVCCRCGHRLVEPTFTITASSKSARGGA